MRRLVLGVLAITLAASHACAGSSPAFTFIQPLTPNASMFAFGLSGDGLTAVGRRGELNLSRPYYWRNGTTVGLPDLVQPPTSSWGEARAVSADGAVIVGAGGPGSAGNMRATRWLNGAASELVAPASVPVSGSTARAVSSDGTVAVGFVFAGPAHQPSHRAVRWNGSTGADLGGLSGWALHDATGVSGDGLTVSGYSYATTNDISLGRPWAWRSGAVTELPIPSGAFGARTDGVSADGTSIIGSVRVTPGTTSIREEGYLWRNGAAIPLGVPVGPWPQSHPLGVSANGSVVVGWARADFSPLQNIWAFVWDEPHGLRDLNVLLPSLGLDLQGWTLRNAYGVSWDGRTIIGDATNAQGQRAAWVAVIPAPSTVAVALICAADAARRRRRR